ncbi:MAG: RSP_2648 family PIN domain-containing protein [Rubricella sp.]
MERIVLDACTLYPTFLRHILEGCARGGLFTPLWSERILEEWRRTAERVGSPAGAEIALLRSRFPDAVVRPDPILEADIALPDLNDAHVLASAITGGADALLTFNIRDFPTRTLARYGIVRAHPDTFLLSLHAEAPTLLTAAVHEAKARLEAAYGRPTETRTILKKAGLPRLGKAFG